MTFPSRSITSRKRSAARSLFPSSGLGSNPCALDWEPESPSKHCFLSDNFYFSIAWIKSSQPFKLHRKSTGTTDFLQDVHTQFRPEDPKRSECQEFIKDYITTDHQLTVSYKLTGTVVRLGETRKVSVPPFNVESSFKGLNKQLLKGITAYISLIRTPYSKRIAFEFDLGEWFTKRSSPAQTTYHDCPQRTLFIRVWNSSNLKEK